MKDKTRKTKSISFSLIDQWESGLLEYAEGQENGAFSRYIKRLIANDREGWQARPKETAQPIQIEIEEDDKEAMKGFLWG